MPRPRLLSGLVLVLLCLTVVPGGRDAHASFADPDYILQVDMYGDEQVPVVHSVGYGFVRFFFNEDRTTADYTVDVKGFGAPSVLGADIHRGLPGENGPVIKHLADGDFIVTAGNLRLSDAELAEMASGDWYVSLKTRDNPKGEFRGQIELPTDFFPGAAPALPEPVATPIEPLDELPVEYPPYEYDPFFEPAYDFGFTPYGDPSLDFWTIDEPTPQDEPTQEP